MKQTIAWLGLLISIFVLSSCSPSWENRDYTFKEGFEALAKLDEKYGASFHKEQLNATSMVALENVEPFIADLRAFRENIKRTKDSEDKDALIDFIVVRITMVGAEENFQRAQKIGDIGLASDEGGFSCSEVPYLLETYYYYNKTYAYTIKARSDLDTVLHKYREVTDLQQLIGLGENKTQFYYFHLDNIKNILAANEKAVRNFCKAWVVKKSE